MNTFRPIFRALLVICFTMSFVAIAQAQATRTWVSGVGDDVNPCSRTAPCKTFAGAISKTATHGEINCLDPGGYGSLTITKSITVDCHEIFASDLHTGVNGFVINFDSFADTRKTVRIRNINFNGADSGLIGIKILGATNSANSEVAIEDCLVDGSQSANPNGRGVSDERRNGGKLLVSNTTIRNMGGTGIAIAPTATFTRLDVMINNVRVFNCSFGFVGSHGSRTQIFESTFSGNTNAGIAGEGTSGASEVNVDHCIVNGNGTGLNNLGGSTIRFSNTSVTSNATGFSGATSTYGNNQVNGNTVLGTVPTGPIPQT